MSLYGFQGFVQRSQDPYKDYFGDIRKTIDAKMAVEEATKAAEDAALEAIGDLPDLGPNSMFLSYADAQKQMATYLRDHKDELLATEEGRIQYQNLLDGATQWSAYGKDHTAKVNPILKRNMKIAKSGVNPKEWDDLGMQDSHSYEEYVAKTAELDSARFQVTVKDGKWVINDAAGEHSISDPSLFDLTFFEDHLTQTPEKPPTQWWSLNHQDSKYNTEDEAVAWVAASVADNSRFTVDAVRWAEKNGVFEEGMTADEALKSPGRVEEAIEAYARAAVPEGWTKEDGRSGRSRSGSDEDVFTISEDQVIRSSSENAGRYPSEDNSSLLDEQDVASYEMPQVLTVNAVTWQNPSVEEGRQAFSVAGLQYQHYAEPGAKLHIMTSAGEVVPVIEGSNEYVSLKRQMDEKLGTGAFEKIVRELRGAAAEHSGDVVDPAQWELDNLDVIPQEEVEPQPEGRSGMDLPAEGPTFARGGRILSRLFGR